MFTPKDIYTVRPFWWFWLPLAVLAFVTALNPFLTKEHTGPWMYAENGFLETLQWIVALTAAGFGLACLRYCRSRAGLFAWVLLGTLACLYIGLEEISYGQHLFKWETPEYWQSVNDQNETNLHNTSSWLDQKPRLILLFGVLAGGILLPLARRYKPSLLPAKLEVLYPSSALFWVACMAIFAHAAKWAKKLGLGEIYNRASEVNELYMYYFVLLYLVFLYRRLRHESLAAA